MSNGLDSYSLIGHKQSFIRNSQELKKPLKCFLKAFKAAGSLSDTLCLLGAKALLLFYKKCFS